MKTKSVLVTTLALSAIGVLAAFSQDHGVPLQQGPVEVEHAYHHDVSPALRTIPPVRPREGKPPREVRLRFHRPIALKHVQTDPVAQLSFGTALATAPRVGFDGIGVGVPNYRVIDVPPDPNGAPGAQVTLNGQTINQYVQWVNEDFAVFDKGTGAILYGPVPGNTLWSGFGGACETNNDGDPIVQYDTAANRWILTQFSISGGPPFFQCVAVSASPDATGSYHRYAFQYSDENDYPKLGVWPDAYYISFNMFRGDAFVGSRVCAYDRTAMLVGAPTIQQCAQLSPAYGGLLPSDLDGSIAPPTGSPNFFLAFDANVLRLWKFHVDWTTPANSTLTGPITIPVAAFTEACNGGTCVPQSRTKQRLDSLGDRLMYRLAYRRFSDGHEALIVNHSVNAGNGIAGIRWYELRNPAGST